MPISRQTPLKQNIRVWFDYLKVAIEAKHNINKEYYRLWHLPQVKKLKFDKWWKSHKHLFVHKQIAGHHVFLQDYHQRIEFQLHP